MPRQFYPAGLCAALKNGKECKDPKCSASHFYRTCDFCRRVFYSDGAWQGHVKGQDHKKREAKGVPIFNLNDSGTKTSKSKPPCPVCQTYSERSIKAHNQSIGHKRRVRFHELKKLVEEAKKNKCGVVVEGQFDFDVVERKDAEKGIARAGSLRLTSSATNVTLLDASLGSTKDKQKQKQIPTFSVQCNANNRNIQYPRPTPFTVTAKQNFHGRSSDILQFVFVNNVSKQKFIITRELRIIVGSKKDHETLKAKAPYQPLKEGVQHGPVKKIVEGIKPSGFFSIPYRIPLPHADIPKDFASDLGDSTLQTRDLIQKVKDKYLPPAFDRETYGAFFKTLLWAEEKRQEVELEYYNMEGVRLSREGNYFFLVVPGLSEKRPSVLVGDQILVQQAQDTSGKWFRGYVHIVRRDDVGLRFSLSFGSQVMASALFNVKFKFNRIPMRRQHQAMDKSHLLEDRQHFPFGVVSTGTASFGVMKEAKGAFKMFNSLISNNEKQLQAVGAILLRPPGSTPFIIFGPPGTGKTVTCVEAILQLFHHNPITRILACAPSNSAADLIASRLVSAGLSSDDLFRMCAPSRVLSQLPKDLLPYVYTHDNHFSVPSLDKLGTYRIVVSTCVSAYMLFGVGIPPGHYTHIFVDEAGQATEPEVMVPVATLAVGDFTNIVLSGDPKQLGPIIRSTVARMLGLEKSYLERIMEREGYNEDTGPHESVVKLVQNFRSHPSILSFPSEKFYKSELIPCGDPAVTHSFIGSSHLVNKDFPVVFYAISGKDEREASSPSFFNIDEITQVRTIVEELQGDSNKHSVEDIGIITPYRAQGIKIRKALHGIAEGIKVGSVEEFQGQERKIIIVSTVRSSQEYLAYDLRHTLGFVANRRRFNVAITRTKALLFVVGDPSVLSLDPIWRGFLNYIHQNNGWVGPPPSWDTTEAVDERKRYDHDVRNSAENSMMELVDLFKSLGMDDGGAGLNRVGQKGEDEEDEDEVDVFEQPAMEEV